MNPWRALPAILVLLPLAAQGAEWVRILGSQDRNQHFYDDSKLVVEGQEITYWRKVIFWSPQQMKTGAARSAMYRERMHCAQHTHRTLGYLFYAEDGTVIENVYTPDAPAVAIVPETVGDQVEKAMCAMVSARAAQQEERRGEDLDAARKEIGGLKQQVEQLEVQLRQLRDKLGGAPSAPPAPPDAPATER